MAFVIRGEFPDEDKYAYVTNDDGALKIFHTRELAEEEAKKWAGITVIIEVNNEGINWGL